MKNLISALVVACALIAAPAFAQQATQQSATRADAANLVQTSATSAATITITPPSGQYVYLTGLDITNCAGSSAVSAAAVTTISTTNLGGVAWTIGSGVAAGLCQPAPTGPFSLPLKSTTAGSAATIVLPTFATNQTIRVNAYYYFAP
jgi:hypothetical protein